MSNVLVPLKKLKAWIAATPSTHFTPTRKKMNVLSLFDGISCARVALDDRVATYHASEIDKYASAISARNFPDIVRHGSVCDLKAESFTHPIDLLIGGSPCQDLTRSNTSRKGLDGTRSKLFWEYVRLWKELKPKWFLFENVASMTDECRDIISDTFGMKPITIDSSNCSPQARVRCYWTNIPVVGSPSSPINFRTIADIAVEDSEVPMKNYITDADGNAFVSSPCKGRGSIRKIGNIGKAHQGNRVYDSIGCAPTLICRNIGFFKINNRIRKLTMTELERLQGLPDGYTAGSSDTRRSHGIGNGFQVDTIQFILNFIP